MRDIPLPFVFIPLLLLLLPLIIYISTRRNGKKLTDALTRLYQGNLHAFEHFHFLDTQVTHLYFPFSESELRRIDRWRDYTRHDLTVELLHPRQAFWGNYYFHIACHYEGVDDQYQPFTLQKEGYLYIACGDLRGHWLPCITHVERRSQPFIV